jgi:peptidoglycan hydrolase-like protein with peptidoglycan-binding domain
VVAVRNLRNHAGVTREHEPVAGGGEEAGRGAIATSGYDRVVASGSVGEVATLLATQPARRDQILTALHQTRGNAFVQQVTAHAHAHSHAHHDEHEEPAGEDAKPVAGGRLTRNAGNAELDQIHAGTLKLKKGDRGTAVRRVQVALHDLGFEVNIHGLFDDRMQAAVNALQIKAKLSPINGEVDARTFDAIEDRLRSREAYANAAKETKPNHYQFDEPDAQNPPKGILRKTGSLSDADKAEAQRVLGPDPATIGAFDQTNAKTYETQLEKFLREDILADAPAAKAHNKQHDKGDVFGIPHIARIGNRAKQAVDKVFGSFKIGADFIGGKNLHDKNVAEKNDIAKAAKPADERQKKALQRVEKIINTDDKIESLHRKFNVDRTRGPEKAIIEAVKARVAKDLEEELLAIMFDWSASAGRDGVRINMRKRGDDESNRLRLWEMFGTLVHEYVHTLEHSAWTAYKGRKSKMNPEAGATLREGVTELLTRTVFSVTSLADKKLKKDIEGEYYDEDADSPDDLRGGKYQTETNRAEQLAGIVGINNIYGAYFVGRTDLVGDG